MTVDLTRMAVRWRVAQTSALSATIMVIRLSIWGLPSHTCWSVSDLIAGLA